MVTKDEVGQREILESGDPSAAESSSADLSKNVIQLEASDIARGDLILVNGDHAYDFEANADLTLANIKENQSVSYAVASSDFCISADILAQLDQLVYACNEAMGTQETGIESAHRTLEYQQNVRDQIAAAYGEEYASSVVADPGYSEHHTGLALDFGIFYEDGLEGSFSESPNAEWMKQNAWQYGFVRRFAEDKVDITHIANEAWHFRYVGVPHAYYMTLNNLCLEEYIDYLRMNTGPDTPLAIAAAGKTYQVYFTTDTLIKKPESSYTISGNNVDGFIVTVTVE